MFYVIALITTNSYRIYTKGNEKEIKTYHYKKISETQRKTAKEGKEMKKLKIEN